MQATDPLAEPLTRADGEHVARYDWRSSVPLSTVLVELVAELEDDDPERLPELRRVVDPEALDDLFASTGATPGEHHAASRLSFRYADRHVTVEADGVVRIGEASDASDRRN